MALCWLSLILLLFTFSTYAIAATTQKFTLTAELTNFVPACAQDCFTSFLDNNFQGASCLNTPSLSCLCSHNTTTGYTVGEGAVQCIISQQNTGFCSGKDAAQSVALTAFQMCNGQKSALPNTHGTITATLIIQTTMSSIALVAPATTMTMSTSITTTMATIAGSAQPSATATDPSASATSTAVAGPAPTTLTKTQIIGITAGLAGGGLLCVLIIMLILCLQRRKTRKMTEARDSDMLPFQMDPEFYGMHGGLNNPERPMEPIGPGGRASGMASKKMLQKLPPLVPPVPTRLDISSPNMFSRHIIQPNTIRLAISPDRSVATEKTPRTPKRASKLLPEKPTLKLTMPPSRKRVEPAGLSMPPMLKSAISRNSAATQFEIDDDDSADTAVNSDNTWGRGSTDQILKNNKIWEADAAGPEPPTAAIAVMRPDEFHWRPSSIASPTSNTESPIVLNNPPALMARGIGSFSQPRKVDIRLQQETPKSLQIKIPEGRAVSSVYTTRGSVPGSEAARHSLGRARKSYGQPGPYDPQSAGSVTTFGTLDSAVSPEEDVRFAELSPVVESPRERMIDSPQSGKSPVSYPKIPKRLSSAQMAQPPPPQPKFATPVVKPWRLAEVVSQRDREAHAYDAPQDTPSEIQIGMLSPRLGLGHQQKSSREGNYPARTYKFPAPPPQTSQTYPVSQLQQPPAAQLPIQRNGSIRNGLRSPPPSGPHPERRPLSPPPRFPMTPPLPLTQRFPQSPPPSGPLSERRPISPPPRFPMTPPLPLAVAQRTSKSPPPRFQTPPPGPLSARLPLDPGTASGFQNNNLIPLQLSTSPHPPHFNPLVRRSNTASPPPSRLALALNPLSAHPAITFTRSSSLVSQSSKLSSNSNASSLLAKRRGGEMAHALMLERQQSEEDKKRQVAKWRVLNQRGIEEAKREDWRPRLGTVGGLGGNGGEIRETVREFAFERTELPRTPGWVPKLTPTRRGEDLFLSVA